jgi:DNA-binding transcriptional ArsR family regulator
MTRARKPPSEDRIVLDPHNLKGLAHPLRVKILGALRTFGPSTATRLAEQLGESSGATSYHLRQLEAYGFVIEDTERTGQGRERWWRSAQRFTELPRGMAREASADAEGFLRALASDCFHEMDGFLGELSALPPEWDAGWTMSDRLLQLTPAEAERLRGELKDLVERYREHDPEAGPDDVPAGSERVVFQVQLLPRLPGGDAT